MTANLTLRGPFLLLSPFTDFNFSTQKYLAVSVMTIHVEWETELPSREDDLLDHHLSFHCHHYRYHRLLMTLQLHHCLHDFHFRQNNHHPSMFWTIFLLSLNWHAHCWFGSMLWQSGRRAQISKFQSKWLQCLVECALEGIRTWDKLLHRRNPGESILPHWTIQ